MAQYPDRTMFVRINALDTELAPGDLEAVTVPALNAVILPKACRPEDIMDVHEILLELEEKKGLASGSIRIIPLIESALGVENAYRIASVRTDPLRLYTLAFGAADYSLDMGVTLSQSGEELAFARARIAVACRAANLLPPIDTPYMIDIKNLEALKEDAFRAKVQGFMGKLCIHPLQVDVVNTVFSPTAEEIAEARRVAAAFEAAEAEGVAAIQLDGRFIDLPVVERSKRILAMADRG